MRQSKSVRAGALCFIFAALAFVGVFAWLAARFNYPDILDGSAAEVLPRLLQGGETMRAVWALYASLPLLLVPGAVAAWLACPSSRGLTTLALVFACIGAFSMCLGLMRWPSIHWELARSFATLDAQAVPVTAAVFAGLNAYLGNYIGEFLGETCLAAFFFFNGCAQLREPGFPRWLGCAGIAFALLFFAGAWRNVLAAVQPLSDLNNVLLPIWLIVLGLQLFRLAPGNKLESPP